MRVNIYAEEMTDRLEVISKEIDGATFTGLRFYLELPATVDGRQYRGPFMHRTGDDDSSAVTFWGKRDLRRLLRGALNMLDRHYGPFGPAETSSEDLATLAGKVLQDPGASDRERRLAGSVLTQFAGP